MEHVRIIINPLLTASALLCVWCVQVDLTEPILSRFDIICVVRDVVDPVEVSARSYQPETGL